MSTRRLKWWMPVRTQHTDAVITCSRWLRFSARHAVTTATPDLYYALARLDAYDEVTGRRG